jgi:hypothetical protein
VEDIEYWKSVAVWMGDVIAATAEHQIGMKSVGRGEKQRHARLAAMSADALEGHNKPSARNVATIVERLRGVPAAESL